MGFIYFEMKCRSVMILVYVFFIYCIESVFFEKMSILFIIIYSDIMLIKIYLVLGIKIVIYNFN